MKLDYNLLKAAALVAPKNDIHDYLNGVRIEPVDDGVCIVATNGHVLFAAFQETSEALDAPVTIPADLAKGCTNKARTRTPGWLEMHIKEFPHPDKTPSYTFNGYPFTPVEGQFPDWRKALPTGTSGEAAAYDPHLYHLAHKVIAIADGFKKWKNLSGTDTPPWIFRLNGHSAAVLTGVNTESIVLLMPLSIPQKPDNLPKIRGITQ